MLLLSFCPIAPVLLEIDSSNYESAPPPTVEHVVGCCVWILSLRPESVHGECNRKQFRPCFSLQLSHIPYPCTSAPSHRNGSLEITSERSGELIEATGCHARWRLLWLNQLGFLRPRRATIALPPISHDPLGFSRSIRHQEALCSSRRRRSANANRDPPNRRITRGRFAKALRRCPVAPIPGNRRVPYCLEQDSWKSLSIGNPW